MQDLRVALRALRSRPWYVAAATLTLALGISATTAIFSVVDALLLRPLPYPDPTHVVRLQTRLVSSGEENVVNRFSATAWRALAERTEIFDAVETFVIGQHVMTGGAEPETVTFASISAGVLPLLGVYPELGRPFTSDDATTNQGRVLLLSHRLWRERFGADPQVVGRRLLLDDVPFEIVGVMPAAFRFPWESVRAWTPFVPAPVKPGGRARTYDLIARVRTELPLDRAQRDLRALEPALQSAGVLPAGRVPEFAAIQTINDRERKPLWMLLGAVALVLAIGCANVMNLGLANASARRQEFAVCTAMGATRGRLARQLLIETSIVCLLGGVAGVWLADTGVNLLAPLMPRELVFLSAHAIRVDSRILMFALAVTLSSAILAGLFPALRGSRADVADALKVGRRTQTATRAERRLLGTSAVVQCALAIVLLAGAGLLIRSFLKLQAVDPGFDTRNLLVISLPLTQSVGERYPDAVSQLAFAERLVEDVRSLPGVRAVALSGATPPTSGGIRGGDLEIDARPGETHAIELPFGTVAPDYFALMGIRLLAGRVFDANAPSTTVVINEVFASRYWGSAQAAVGRRFRLDADEGWLSVAGVVADVRMLGLEDRFGDLEYYQAFQRTGPGYGGLYDLVIRTEVPPEALVASVKQRVWQADPKLPIYQSGDIRAMLAASIARQRFFFLLLTIFAGVAAIVAAIGIYSVFAYSVAQRAQEMGIRLALGATTQQVAGLVLREGTTLAAIGAVLGLAGAWMASRVLTTLLFQTTPTDPAALAGGVAVLMLLALVACYVPARRAQQVDPLIMLKVE